MTQLEWLVFSMMKKYHATCTSMIIARNPNTNVNVTLVNENQSCDLGPCSPSLWLMQLWHVNAHKHKSPQYNIIQMTRGTMMLMMIACKCLIHPTQLAHPNHNACTDHIMAYRVPVEETANLLHGTRSDRTSIRVISGNNELHCTEIVMCHIQWQRWPPHKMGKEQGVEQNGHHLAYILYHILQTHCVHSRKVKSPRRSTSNKVHKELAIYRRSAFQQMQQRWRARLTVISSTAWQSQVSENSTVNMH